MKREPYDLIAGLAAAAFLPNIFLFYLLTNNRVFGGFTFWHSLIISTIISVISIGVFMLYRAITQKTETALYVLIFSWIPFWLFHNIYLLIMGITTVISRRMLVLIHAIVIIALLFLLRKYNPFEKYSQLIIRVLTGVIFVLFLLNTGPVLYTGIVYSVNSLSKQVYDIKSDFVVDEQLPSPDIYWLHMDGMMSFDTVYDYFGDAQEELKIELEQRGFNINEGAELNPGYTQASTVAMLSPDFYDSYFGERLNEVAHLLKYERSIMLHDKLDSDGISLYIDIIPHHEMYKAFSAKGYNTIAIAGAGHGYVATDYFYRFNNDLPLLINESGGASGTLNGIGNIMRLLATTTSLSAIRGIVNDMASSVQGLVWLPIPDYDEEVDRMTMHSLGLATERHLYMRLLDSYSIDSPKFVYLANYIPHSPFNKIVVETGGLDSTPVNPNNVDLLYLLHHEYAAQVLLITIDTILERNPDAVIIIQGDHGIHSITTQPYMLEMGYSKSQVLEMNYSVISAVRMPPQYGGLEEPLDPLDISRLLVNRFVGRNYDMLYDR